LGWLHRYQFPLFFLSSVSEPENSREKIRHMPGKRQAVFVALEILLENLEYLKTRSTWRSRFSRRPTVGIISLVAYSAIFFGLPGTSSIDHCHCAAAEKAHHRRRRGARERGCLGLVVVKKVFDGDARRSRHRIAERVLTLHAGITRAGVHEESTCAGNPVLVLYLLLFWCVVLVVTVDVPDPWMV
jgi:hypothetical protein